MRVTKLKEEGLEFALLGLSLSYDKDPNDMPGVADRKCQFDSGHNKFLESIIVWLDIDAPLYWWKHIDTYRCPQDGEGGFMPSGITKQSESTMHTILRRDLTQDDFEAPVFDSTLDRINQCIKLRQFKKVINNLPDGFLQRRIVTTNYKALRYIIQQRMGHKLDEWAFFVDEIYRQVEHPEYLPDRGQGMG